MHQNASSCSLFRTVFFQLVLIYFNLNKEIVRNTILSLNVFICPLCQQYILKTPKTWVLFKLVFKAVWRSAPTMRFLTFIRNLQSEKYQRQPASKAPSVPRLQGDRWISLPPMPTSRAGAAVAVLGKQVLVVGGVGENQNPLKAVEMYNTEEGRWRKRSALREALMGISITVKGMDYHRLTLNLLICLNSAAQRFRRDDKGCTSNLIL